MEEPFGALLEERSDNDFAELFCKRSEALGARSRDRLREIEQDMIFALTEILRLEEFGKANNVRTLVCGFSDARDGLLKIFFRAWAA
jgi:hypothetical protein